MIRAAIYGRVEKDGDWIKNQSGIETASTSIAVNDASNIEDETVWFNVVGFKHQAHEVCKLKSGDFASIQGQIKLNRYITKEGFECEQWQIVSQNIVSSRLTKEADQCNSQT